MHIYTQNFHLALCEVFDKADITKDGTISIAEYMALCEEYGVELSEADIEAVKEITDEDGEVIVTVHKLLVLHVFRFTKATSSLT